jgi:hypothetical protein
LARPARPLRCSVPSPLTDPDIPDDVLALMRERLHSLDGLEVLLALRAVAPATMPAEHLAEQLRLPGLSVDDALEELRGGGLVRKHGATWSFHPATPAVEASVNTLARIYGQAPTKVMRVLNSLALSRIRGGAATAFADAFLIRKKRKDDG